MTAFLLTCCNANCAVPVPQREFFVGEEEVLTSPEGWEPGALNLAQGLSLILDTQVVTSDMSRLVVNLNEVGEKQLSRFTEKIPEATRDRLIARENGKFQKTIQSRLLASSKRSGQIIHLDIHTTHKNEGTVQLEYTGGSFAQSFCKDIEKYLDDPAINLKVAEMKDPSGLVKWILASNEDISIGSIRLTVSQSYFLRSQPMRWDTLKQLLIKKIATTKQWLSKPEDLI